MKKSIYTVTLGISILVGAVFYGLLKVSIASANMPVQVNALKKDFFEGVDEIVIWPSMSQHLINGKKVADKFSLSQLEDRCASALEKGLSEAKKEAFKIVKLSDTDVSPYDLSDEKKILLKCTVSFEWKNAQIIGAVMIYLWRAPPSNLQNTTRVSGFHKNFTGVHSPALFVANNLDNYKGQLTETVDKALNRVAKQINTY